jgi:predicted O-methyltransferase YrrM
LLSGITYPLYERYYSAKWGGPPGGEAYDRPFNGAMPMLFVDYLRDQELYQQLANSYDTVEGNLLERADARTTAAQIEALRYAIRLAQPRSVLETGTGKSMFGYVLSHLVHGVTLYTFDGDPRCVPGVALLNAAQTNIQAKITFGDTKQTLSTFNVPGIGLAWIDGGHDEATVLNDIQQAIRLDIPLIAIDDARTMPEVASAINHALNAHSTYVRLENPFYDHDTRGIMFLRRR